MGTQDGSQQPRAGLRPAIPALAREKRNQVLELWEVERYGTDSYGDAEYVSVYGMMPAEWHARGIRLLARTAVECTRDVLGDAIARDVAAVVSKPRPRRGSRLSIPSLAPATRSTGSCAT
jgi:hypothetical protein